MSGECEKCGEHALECLCPLPLPRKWIEEEKEIFPLDVLGIDSEFTKNSEFYHFGILPQVCIHSLIEDEYSKMYSPREKCSCGSSDWIEGKMDIVKPVNGYQFPQKDVHRCKECNEVRMDDHISLERHRRYGTIIKGIYG